MYRGEPGRLQSMGSQGVEHTLATKPPRSPVSYNRSPHLRGLLRDTMRTSKEAEKTDGFCGFYVEYGHLKIENGEKARKRWDSVCPC